MTRTKVEKWTKASSILESAPLRNLLDIAKAIASHSHNRRTRSPSNNNDCRLNLAVFILIVPFLRGTPPPGRSWSPKLPVFRIDRPSAIARQQERRRRGHGRARFTSRLKPRPTDPPLPGSAPYLRSCENPPFSLFPVFCLRLSSPFFNLVSVPSSSRLRLVFVSSSTSSSSLLLPPTLNLS